MQIGPYLRQDELGRCGAGPLVRAQHLKTEEKVAIKLLDADPPGPSARCGASRRS